MDGVGRGLIEDRRSGVGLETFGEIDDDRSGFSFVSTMNRQKGSHEDSDHSRPYS